MAAGGKTCLSKITHPSTCLEMKHENLRTDNRKRFISPIFLSVFQDRKSFFLFIGYRSRVTFSVFAGEPFDLDFGFGLLLCCEAKSTEFLNEKPKTDRGQFHFWFTALTVSINSTCLAKIFAPGGLPRVTKLLNVVGIPIILSTSTVGHGDCCVHSFFDSFVSFVLVSV